MTVRLWDEGRALNVPAVMRAAAGLKTGQTKKLQGFTISRHSPKDGKVTCQKTAGIFNLSYVVGEIDYEEDR